MASYPVSLCFVKFPIGKFLSVSLYAGDFYLPGLIYKADNYLYSIIWAIVLACHGATSNFAGLVSLRVLLGVFESTIGPGLSLLTGLWYKRSEHASRHGIWFAGNSVSSIFGGLLTYGIGHISNSVEPWRVRWPSPPKHFLGISFSLDLNGWCIVDFYHIRHRHLCIWNCLLYFPTRQPSQRPIPF